MTPGRNPPSDRPAHGLEPDRPDPQLAGSVIRRFGHAFRSSGVGVASLQMAKVLGARVIGTSGSQAKLDQLKPLGLDVGLCTRAADFHQAVLQATDQKGANLASSVIPGIGPALPSLIRRYFFHPHGKTMPRSGSS